VAPGGRILDAGCGSGRDSLAFLKEGYQVDAFDASEEICRLASRILGFPVECKRFEDLTGVSIYDGIWACASLLHLPKHELPPIFFKLATALKADGYLYASFKYGSFDGERNGRYFSDLTETGLSVAISASSLKITEQWLTEDVRPGRSETWLNTILIKR
jgi:SAM-dependent methyltransferase